MSKKLKIDQLKVQSFVTTANPSQIAGGGTFTCELEPTNYSCYRYVSCYGPDCIIRSHAEPCWQDTVERVTTRL